MNRTLGQALLLGLLAAVAMRLGPDSRPRTAGNDAGGAPVQEETTPRIDFRTAPPSIRGKDPECLIEEFYSAQFDTSSPGFFDTLAAAVSRVAGISAPRPSPPTLAEVGSLRAAADEHGIRVQFLILSVPDPIDSNLGYFSDITLDGLQRAAERRGYVFDRYWLPWAPARDGPGMGLGVLSKTADHVPGLVLFRCSQNAGDVLAVFVVGETPTTGIDKVALKRSLNFLSFWQAVPRAPASAGPEPRAAQVDAPSEPLSKTSLRLHLLAPFFSGAAASIRLAISEWFKEWSERNGANASVAVSCVSGSASAISNKSVLEFREPPDNQPGLSVTFHATVIPDSVIREVLLDHLWQHGIEPHQVAFLTEADTSFGEQLLLPVAKPQDGIAKNAGQTIKSPQGDVLQVPFPMHISSMRSAYDKDSRLLTGKRRDVDNAPKSNLDLSLGDTRGTPQHVPSFSPTAISSVERSIAHILLSMARRGIRCIGLIATDVRDQLFLAEQVRFYCPDVQLVLFRADSIFTHPDVGPALEGSLIATTYPLISKNQKWTALDPRSASRRISFTNVASEGVYNATLALLALSDSPAPGASESWRCSDDRPRAAKEPASSVTFEPLEYRTPFEDIGDGYHVAPPVWLTAVSNGEFWPIAVVPREKWEPLELQQLTKNGGDKTIRAAPGDAQDAAENDQRYVLRAVSEKKPQRFYRDSSATYGDPEIDDGLRGMLALIATAFSGFCLASALRYLAGHFVARDGGDDAVRHYWWPVPYFLSLLAAEIALASPTLVHLSLWFRGRLPFGFETDNWRRQAIILAVLVTEHAALWSLFAAAAVGTVVTAWRQRIRQDGAQVLAMVKRTVSRSFIVAAGVELVVLYLVSDPSKPLSDAAIFLERSAHFGDRVTPTLPCFFVAIAIAWWFRGHLQRRSFAGRFPLLNTFERAPQQGRDLNYAGLAQIIRPLVDCLESGRGWPSRNDAEDFTWRALLGHGFASVSRVLAWHTLIIFPFLFLVIAWAHSLAAYESAEFNTVVWLTWLAVVGLVWLTIWQFLWGTYVFLELLRRLARHPMADAFQRLPRKTRKALAWLLLSRLPRRFELEASLRIWQSLQVAVAGTAATANNTSLRTQLDELNNQPEFQKADVTAAAFADWLDETQSGAQQRSRAAFERAIFEATVPLLPMLAELWRERFEARQCRLLERRGAQCGLPIGEAPKALSPEERRWLSMAERLVVIQMGTLFCQVFWHLRRLLISALLIMVFLLASMNSYNFQPRRMLVAFEWALVTAFVVAAVTALVRLNRNELLSRISGTAPDQVTWNLGLVASLGAYALIPILSALSFQFPQVGRLTFFVSDALLHAFR